MPSIDQVKTIPSIKSDHLRITLSVENQTRGQSLRKFDESLLNDSAYVYLISENYQLWFKEFEDVEAPRLFWDLIKIKTEHHYPTAIKKKQEKESQNFWQLKIVHIIVCHCGINIHQFKI